jgi:hypothetical protein
MSLFLDDPATEESTYLINAVLRNEDNTIITPKTLLWTLTDRKKNVINSREDVAVSPPGTSNLIVLSGNDLVLAGNSWEERLIQIDATYDSDNGSDLPLKKEIRFNVIPILETSLFLEDPAEENGTYIVTVTFKNEYGVDVTPTAASWSLVDKNGNTINSRSNVSIESPSSTETIVLSGNDLALWGESYANRWMVFSATYNSANGTGLPLKKSVRFTVVQQLNTP